MTQAERNAALNALASGNVAQQTNNSNVVTVQQYQGCDQNGNVGPTATNIPIDFSQMNKDQTGMVTLYVDLTTTSIGARVLTLGGSLANSNAAEGSAAIAQEYYDFPSGNYLFDVDNGNVIGGNQANYAPDKFMPWFDNLVGGKGIAFQRVDVADNGSSGTAFSTFKNSTLFKSTIQMGGNWETISPKIKPVFCDPCLQDDDKHASWIGKIPVDSNNAMAMVLPVGLKANFEFCVYVYQNASNVTTA